MGNARFKCLIAFFMFISFSPYQQEIRISGLGSQVLICSGYSLSASQKVASVVSRVRDLQAYFSMGANTSSVIPILIFRNAGNFTSPLLRIFVISL